MNGRSITEIAAELNIPEGTVKSRLHLGRKRIRKGINDMEKYTKQSCSPVTLHLSYSGSPSLNGEPNSLIHNDLIAQNILWFAYTKSVTLEEISLALGLPAAYAEPVLQKLVDGQLMKQLGSKYYTDFIIFAIEDQERYIPAQKQFAAEYFDLFWKGIDSGITAIKQQEFYKRCSDDAKNALELYFAFHCLDYGIYSAFSQIFNTEQHFAERPNGGYWIAFGTVNQQTFHPERHKELLAHSYSGERIVKFDQYADCRLEMHVYSPDGFPCYPYYASSEYTFFPDSCFVDSELTKLLYLVYTETAPETVGFNPEYLKAIPWLTKCKIFRSEAGKPLVNIPVLNKAEADMLWHLCAEAQKDIVENLQIPLAAFLKGKKQKLPTHLDSVPLQKQYLYADNAMLFAVIREAIKNEKLYDGNYDDDSNGINQPPCPMVFMIDNLN